MKTTGRIALVACMAALVLAACVTVNIYFPAAKVDKAAERIVDDVYGDGGQQNGGDGSGEPSGGASEQESSSGLTRFFALLGPPAAWAQDATSVSNAAIRGLKNEIRERHKQLASFYDKGNVGITNKGYLEIRNTKGLSLQDTARLKRLVSAENNARKQLYREVAGALNIDPSQVGKVEDIFAKHWRGKARAGWWIQSDGGQWAKK